MPIFELAPVDLDHSDWQASTRKGRCRVHAPDENDARDAAHMNFWIAGGTGSAAESLPLSPWRAAKLTECKEVADPPPEEYREGQIEVPETWVTALGPSGTPRAHPAARSEWRVVKEGRPPQMAPTGATAVTDEAIPASADNTVIARHAAERDEAQSITAAMSGSVLPPVHGEGVVGGGPKERDVDLDATLKVRLGIAAEATVERDPVRIFRERLTEAPDDLAQAARFVIECAQQQLDHLKHQRSNTPEAGDAIEGLETFIKMVEEFHLGIEDDDPPDQTVSRFQRMMGHLLDDLERYLSAGGLVRTTFASLALVTCAAFGVDGVAAAIVAVSAMGADKKILDGVRSLFKRDNDE